jgi:hypothetical protein
VLALHAPVRSGLSTDGATLLSEVSRTRKELFLRLFNMGEFLLLRDVLSRFAQES